ncbi:type VI secretion system-associated FHA domain protein TagH [Erwinia sp. ErVv1]|uniref:type VI secretion system-associated FHA domain protein TagH n=1 Tax=Erwinia sp. ErVv1 TaxID=1603299 RepID=UPI000835A04E|nr:type VI secretion system-associated FHA domain protein TagH [Erwinia sp. ErVv1]
MRFTIIATKSGQQPPQSSCDFLPPGGTIGRGADNNLVLPDDDRTISRLQAIVHITADGECRITNRGTVTLVHLNDIPLERGRQVELQDGDILTIDDYRLQVSDLNSGAQPVAAAAVARPAALMARPADTSSARPAASSDRPAAPVAHPAPPTEAKENSPAAIPSEIWESLAQEFSITDSLSNRSKPARSSANPLTEGPAPDRNPVDPLAQFASGSDALNFDRRNPTPDSLFNNDELFKQESIFNDSTPSSLLQQQATKPTPSGKDKDEVDPLALFGGGSAAAKVNSDDPLGLMMGNAVPLTPLDEQPGDAAYADSPLSDDSPRPVAYADSPLFDDSPRPAAYADSPLSDDSPRSAAYADSSLFDESPRPVAYADSPLFDESPRPAASPSGQPSLASEPAASQAERSSADRPAEPTDESPESNPLSSFNAREDDLSRLASSPLFDDEPAQAPTQPDYGGITLPTPQAVARNTTPPPKGRLRIDPVSNTASSSSAAGTGSGELLDGELMDALISGMGLNDLQPTPRFDRDAMEELGQMLGMFSQGTVALLSSRSILKRGVKAEMTVILDEANNPFKLLPSGKSVLMQMFGSRMPGFMPPKQSVRDALVDLQAHQLGMIAGIRAIIASMLQSFNPQQLEEEARREGATSRLSLPSSRKAALWEHFTKRYGETAGEIEDDFHTLFGEAFLHAYDMEVNQYKDSQIRSEE